MTVAEVSAVGLPAIYVPLPHGNGEQALNAATRRRRAAAACSSPDAELTGERVAELVTGLVGDPDRLAAMAAAARASGHAGADETLARIVLEAAGTTSTRERRGTRPVGPGGARTHAGDRPRCDTDVPPLPRLLSRVHFIGIGGAAMSGIARILLARGATVSGSDAKDSRAVLALRALGAEVAVGHDAAQPDLLPRRPTVRRRHEGRASRPTRQPRARRGRARAASPCVHRSAALAALTAGRRAGRRRRARAGKTSTTSMLAVALQHCGTRPVVRDRRRPARVRRRARTTASATCSSPRPTRATGRSSRSRRRSRSSPTSSPTTSTTTAPPRPTSRCSTRSPRRIEPGGALVTCADDPGAAALGRPRGGGGHPGAPLRAHRRPAPTTRTLLDYRAEGAGSRRAARSRWRGASTELRLAVPGEHMALNALAALLAGRRARARRSTGLLDGLAGFDGVRRRFEFRGRAAGVRGLRRLRPPPDQGRRPAARRPRRCSAGPGG